MRIEATSRESRACVELCESVCVSLANGVSPARAVRHALAGFRERGRDRLVPRRRWESWVACMERFRVELDEPFPHPDSPGAPITPWWDDEPYKSNRAAFAAAKNE